MPIAEIHRSVVDAFHERAVTHPRTIAVRVLDEHHREQQRWSYGRVHDHVWAMAARLGTRTIPGDTAMLVMPFGVEFVTALLGCLYAGLSVVAAEPRVPHRALLHVELDDLLRDAEPRVLVAPSEEAEAASLLRAGQHRRCSIVSAQFARVRRAPVALCPIVAAETTSLIWYPPSLPTQRARRSLSHAGLLDNIRALEVADPSSGDEVLLNALPASPLGLVSGLLGALCTGRTTALIVPRGDQQRPVTRESAAPMH